MQEVFTIENLTDYSNLAIILLQTVFISLLVFLLSKKTKTAEKIMLFICLGMGVIGIFITIWRLHYANIYDLNLMSISVEHVGIFICTILIGGCAYSVKNDDTFEANLLFIKFVFVTALNWFSDAFYWSMNGINTPLACFLNKFFTCQYYLLSIIVIYAFVKYLFVLIPSCERKLKTALSLIKYYFVTTVILIIVNLYIPIYFQIVDGKYERLVLTNINFIVAVVFNTWLFTLVKNYKGKLIEKYGIICYLVLPILCNIIQIINVNFAFAQTSVLIAVCLFYVHSHMRQELRIKEQSIELEKQKTALSLSQIKPHFMYNTLTSIASLCETDPTKAEELTLSFSSYLRANLDSLSKNELVHFDVELDHVNTYLEIEKTRFPDINISYDIKARDFMIPSLSVQPLVENAVKHGVRKMEDAGAINIATKELAEEYQIIISDNGIGFDQKKTNLLDGSHYGIENVRNRLEIMCNGKLEISSRVGKGTVAKIRIPKDGGK